MNAVARQFCASQTAPTLDDLKLTPEALEEPLAGHSRYHKIRDLNTGTFGFVQLAWDVINQELVAIKFVFRGEKVTKYVEREIVNHRCLLHPHIIQFKEVFLTQRCLAVVMEYAEGGDLYDFVVRKGGLHEHEARWFFQQLIVAIDYCHRRGVVSRDIKLENALLDGSPRPLLKLCDFGYSKHELMHSQPQSKVGTPAYIAPEVIEQSKYDGKKADIWSCGVMLYVMLFGKYPFERMSDADDPQKLKKILSRIVAVEYEIPPGAKLSSDGENLLRRMLVKDPMSRITIPEIYAHPWYQTELPEGVDTMNDVWEAPMDSVQSLETVQKVILEARSTPSSLGMDLIDAAIDEAAASFEGTDDEGSSSVSFSWDV